MNIRYITEMISWLGFFSAVFLSYYYYLQYRNKERMKLIENNIDLSELYKRPERHFPWFMIGFSLLGIGIGLTLSFGIAFGMSHSMRMKEEQIAFLTISSSVLFAAIGIIIGHSIEQRKKKSRG